MNPMDWPSMDDQPFCPVCGKTGKLDGHHVVHRSQGGEDGPIIYICRSCHAQHHDVGDIAFAWDGEWYWKDKISNKVTRFRIYDPQHDPVPFDEPDDLWGELQHLLVLALKLDYLTAEKLDALVGFYGDRKPVEEGMVDTLDFNPKSVKSYLTKRLRYYSLVGEGVDEIGVTAGCRLAKLVDEGHDSNTLVSDWLTMPREQFDATYPKPERKKRTCPKCGESL